MKHSISNKALDALADHFMECRKLRDEAGTSDVQSWFNGKLSGIVDCFAMIAGLEWSRAYKMLAQRGLNRKDIKK